MVLGSSLALPELIFLLVSIKRSVLVLVLRSTDSISLVRMVHSLISAIFIPMCL